MTSLLGMTFRYNFEAIPRAVSTVAAVYQCHINIKYVQIYIDCGNAILSNTTKDERVLVRDGKKSARANKEQPRELHSSCENDTAFLL